MNFSTLQPFNLLTFLIFLTFQPIALAQSPLEPMILSLPESVQLALENNFEIAVERRSPKISETVIEIERAGLDMSLNAGISGGGTRRPTASMVEAIILGETVTGVEVTPIEEADLRYDLGITKRLPTGGSYDLSFGVTRQGGRSTVFDPNFSSDLTLTLTQPLLKGFGTKVTQTELLVAKNNYLVSREAFESRVTEVIESVEKAYWDLVFQRKNLKVQQDALRAAQELLAQNRAKVEQGVLASIEVLVAESGAASREEDVVVGEAAVRNAEDKLWQVMNVPDQSLVETRAIIPTSEPSMEERRFQREEAIKAALSKLPDLKKARLDLKNRELLLHQAKNQLWPSLDFQSSAGLEGLEGSYGDNLDRLGSRDFYNWAVGLVLNVPLGNRAAQATYYKRRYELEKAALTLKKLEQDVVLDLKEAIREVETDLARMNSARKARLLTEKKLEAETERLRVGLTTTRNVLDFQKDLAEAQNRELKAIIDYNKALVKLARVQGTLLQERDISLSDTGGPLPPPEAAAERGLSH